MHGVREESVSWFLFCLALRVGSCDGIYLAFTSQYKEEKDKGYWEATKWSTIAVWVFLLLVLMDTGWFIF